MTRAPEGDRPVTTAPEDGIRATLAAYCQHLDDGRFDEWVEVFTDDVVYAVMGHVAHGRDDVRQLIEPLMPPEERGRHLLSQPLITVDGDSATATTDYCFVSQGLQITSAGRYHDRLVRDGGRWRIAARQIVFLGQQPRGLPDDPV